MKFIIIADVLLHVAGLSVVTNEVPNDCGIKIIMPRVQYVSPFRARFAGPSAGPTSPAPAAPVPQPRSVPAPQPSRAQAAPAPQPSRAPHHSQGQPAATRTVGAILGDTPHVQDHISMLIFKTASLATAVNWPKVDLTGVDAGYSYVVMEGDYVRLVANRPDAPAKLDKLVLPRLQKSCCPQMTSLKSEYRRPYSGATAVFDIPQGELTSCLAPTREGPGRLDTELRLKSNNGFFVVSASTMTTTKELRFKVEPGRNLELVAANVPRAFLAAGYATPEANAIDGVPHYQAYYQMGDGQSASCNQPLEEWRQKNIAPINDLLGCQVTVFATVAGKTNPLALAGGIAHKTLASNFECSNSQWP